MSQTPDPLDDAIDQAFAETVAHLRDVEAAARDVEQEHEDDECEHAFEPRHMALVAAIGQVEEIFSVAECAFDREQGVDCDHQVAGEECRVDTLDAETTEALVHQATCPNCTAAVVLSITWPYAVSAESAMVLQHLMMLRTRAEHEGDSAVALVLSEAIDNIANARHRMHDH